MLKGSMVLLPSGKILPLNVVQRLVAITLLFFMYNPENLLFCAFKSVRKIYNFFLHNPDLYKV